MKEKTILHSDVNNFFASVECANNPKLAGIPVAVTGNPEKRNGIILAKNEIAKKFGVKTGEAIWQAKAKCPELLTIGPHYELYEKISKQLQELYLDYTDLVEPLGLDECWLDITPSLAYLKKDGKQIADEIRARIKTEFGFTVSVGVSFSKIFAKLGSDLKKPDATTVIDRINFKQTTYNLPLSSVVGIGAKLGNKFTKMNVNTIGDFTRLEEAFVRQNTNITGSILHQKLKGKFDEEVKCYYTLEPPKSIGNGTTTIVDIKERDDIMKVVMFLSEKISLRMAKSKLQGATISVTLKTNEFEKVHHSRTFPAIQSGEEIFSHAKSLIDSFWKYNKFVRAIRVRMSSLSTIAEAEQLSFFNEESNRLNSTIKTLKEKYGNDKIYIASDTVSYINRKSKDEETPQNK